METVTSADGVTLAYDRIGNGPPLVFVVGAFCTRFTLASLAERLSDQFTVFNYDRRGRGDSDDNADYAVEREYDDLHAILERAGSDAAVYGHSSGAALALEAAAAGVPMRRLAAYEPPFRQGAAANPGFAAELRALLEAGDREEAARAFVMNTGQPRAVAEALNTTAYWPNMVALAPTLLYDVTLCDVGSDTTEWLAKIPVPVLAVAGSRSAPWAAEAAQTIADTASHATALILDDEDHNVSADAIAPVLRDFFGAN